MRKLRLGHWFARLLCWTFGHNLRWKWVDGEWQYTYCDRCGVRYPEDGEGGDGNEEKA